MNYEEFPEIIKKDIEDQSLSILQHIAEEIIVIGGWAVRALTGDKHARYTLDIDGVTEQKTMKKVESILKLLGMNGRKSNWGIQFYQHYTPQVKIPEEIRKEIDNVELRIEISEPRIKESQTHHYFEFDLTEFIMRDIQYHMKKGKVTIKVPPAEYMAAVKLGLPADYKNNFDSQVLLEICNVEKVVEIIKLNDDWSEMVRRRIPKLIGRLNDKDRLEHILAINNGINIKEHIKTMKYIENKLKT
ncbi:MAG: hypothetical protein KKC68_00650 [Candidatus Thermoplasmatota archaeon]|nr:hypothetical protein [Candidatus Thermoplasmatota archaeon]